MFQAAVGLELWSMSNMILFDNIIITDEETVADNWAAETFDLKRRKLDKDGVSGTSLAIYVNDWKEHSWNFSKLVVKKKEHCLMTMPEENWYIKREVQLIFCPCMLSCWVSCIWNPILLLSWKQQKWRKFCGMRLSSNHLVYIMLPRMCLAKTKHSCLQAFWEFFLFLFLVHYFISSWKQYAFYIESGFHYPWFLCVTVLLVLVNRDYQDSLVFMFNSC